MRQTCGTRQTPIHQPARRIAESRFKMMREGGKWHLFYLATDDTSRDFRTLFTGTPDECEDRRIRYVAHLEEQITRSMPCPDDLAERSAAPPATDEFVAA